MGRRAVLVLVLFLPVPVSFLSQAVPSRWSTATTAHRDCPGASRWLLQLQLLILSSTTVVAIPIYALPHQSLIPPYCLVVFLTAPNRLSDAERSSTEI